MASALSRSCAFVLITACVIVAPIMAQAKVRKWTSKDGNYTIEAELVSFNKDLIVLKKPDGDLIAVELKELSEEDREFVQLEETDTEHQKSLSEMQTWTSRDGMKVRGRILAFGRKDLVVQRRLSRVYIGDKMFANIDPLHQKLILKVISHLENTDLQDARQLQEWAKSLGGSPKSYTLEGVLMELESGDEIAVPFFLFDPKELEVLEPGWELWLERNESQQSREQEDFLMRAQAMAYQRDRQVDRQIEMVKLGLLGAAAGVVDIWEVGLTPGPSTQGRPMLVLVPAQNSELAAQMALRQYPGSGIIAIRRASRRF